MAENDKLFTRYLLAHGSTRMNVYLDQRLPLGSLVTLQGELEDGRYWRILERYETLEARTVKRGWKNNI